MSLQYVLQQVGYKVGLNPQDSTQRDVLLRFARMAAKELYDTSDMAGSLEEQYFRVNADQTISLPAYVGQVRAMRNSYGHDAIKLSQMRPRYNQINWEDGWRNWRVKGLQTLQAALTNQSQVILSVGGVEPTPMVVNISGSSEGVSSIHESVTMTSIQMLSVNQYLDISNITKAATSVYDLIITDIDGNQISSIPNDKIRAQFQIIDVSTAPWCPKISNPLLNWVEVLYKKSLPWFSNDNDEFPAMGYDDVWVTKCLQLYYEENKDIPSATAAYAKANQMLAQIHEDANRGTDDVVSLVRNPHDSINPRVGFGRDWRWAYRIIGR